MISLFDKELEEMEREVRDLKTIHARGLGAVRFYEAEATKTVAYSQGYATFTITIAQDELTPAIIIPTLTIPEPLVYTFATYSINDDGDSASVTVSAYTPGTVKLKVISSSPIGSIT